MKSYLQILGTETGDTTPSILASFDSGRYLFNVGEGTQRYCIENKLRLSKLTNVFLTRVEWDCCGGVPGMLLSLADAGNRSITIHGGKNLTHFMASTRHFVFRMSSIVTANEFNDASPTYKDDNLDVQAVSILPSEIFHDAELAPAPYQSMAPPPPPQQFPRSEEASQFKRLVISQMFNSGSKLSIRVGLGGGAGWDGKREDRTRDFNNPMPPVPDTNRPPVAVTYICQGPAVRGKFSPDKAAALGVSAGTDFGLLYNGQEVMGGPNRDVLVYPPMVMTPERPGSIFIIVDCPSRKYVGPLCSNEKFVPHYAEHTNNPPSVMIHILGDDVLDDPLYRAWMKKFGDATQHVIVSKKHCAKPIIFQGSAISQHRLSILDPQLFRVPFYSNKITIPGYDDDPIKDYQADLPSKLIVGSSLVMFQMEPTPELDFTEQRAPFDHEDEFGKVLFNLRMLSNFSTDCRRVQSVFQSHDMIREAKLAAEKTPGWDVQVTTLGTGAALPSRYRNVSSTLIYSSTSGSILLDAGEGTYGQMYRRFHGCIDVGLEEVLMSIGLIFVSHMHADHHIGMFTVLLERQKKGSKPKPLCIIGPPQYWTWMREFAEIEDIGIESIEFAQAQAILVRNHLVRARMGIKELVAVQVEHCPYAYALSIEHNTGWKIVYSGDCRPNLDLIRAGSHANLLIHEATFEDDLQGEAIDKRHSTCSEAVIVAQRMSAEHVLLTHFSQRYPRIPKINSPGSNVGIAFDGMTVGLLQLPRLGSFLRPLKLLYP
ncbi:beta-lactamase-like protein, partial [Blyttiomyces helicus]